MNRTYRARIPFYLSALVWLLGAGTTAALWYRLPLPASVLAVLLVGLIERILHSAYTLTDSELILYRGRFARRQTLPLHGIRRVEKYRVPRLGRYCLRSYLLVVHGRPERHTALQPANEDIFLADLEQRCRALHGQSRGPGNPRQAPPEARTGTASPATGR